MSRPHRVVSIDLEPRHVGDYSAPASQLGLFCRTNPTKMLRALCSALQSASPQQGRPKYFKGIFGRIPLLHFVLSAEPSFLGV